MTEIISVRFRGGGKAYFFDPSGKTVKPGDEVVVDTSSGAEIGECVEGNAQVEDDKVFLPLRKMLRFATAEDLKTRERNREREKTALEMCQRKADERKLDMKVVEVEYAFDGSKIVFFFIAEGRIDFRELVKDLAGTFHSRIELRQIGVRDEAKMLGGIGICGRAFCCSQFLKDFHPVSIKMAKEQNLPLNPTKISGSCGRLMCCLKYEQEAYTDLIKNTPRLGSLVQTKDGEGTIVEVGLLRGRLKVQLADPNETIPKMYDVKDVKVLRAGRVKIKPAPEVDFD